MRNVWKTYIQRKNCKQNNFTNSKSAHEKMWVQKYPENIGLCFFIELKVPCRKKNVRNSKKLMGTLG